VSCCISSFVYIHVDSGIWSCLVQFIVRCLTPYCLPCLFIPI
jgi:hypothetical protein